MHFVGMVNVMMQEVEEGFEFFGDKLNLIIEMRNEVRFGLESASAKSGVSVGVGDKEMYLHRDVMEWTAIYL